MKRAATSAALCLALAACDNPAAAPATQGGEAAGEVLPGSVSDAMIPLEQLDSQAPLAPRQTVPTDTIDAEQPEVDPMPGIEGAPAGGTAAPAEPAAAGAEPAQL
jgi:hypothetical protein